MHTGSKKVLEQYSTVGGQWGAGHDSMVELEGKRLPGFQLQSKFDLVLAHWLPGKPTMKHAPFATPLINYHSRDILLQRLELSLAGAGDKYPFIY